MHATDGLTERQRAAAYYAIGFLVAAFGFIELISIGLPFLIAGIFLLAVGPVRHRREVLWPPLLGIAMFTVVFIAFGPVWCTATSGARVECRGALGLDLPGGLASWALIAVGVGLAGAVALRRRITRRG